MNQKLLNKRARQWREQHGDFLTAYNARLGIVDDPEKMASAAKNTNLLFTTEE